MGHNPSPRMYEKGLMFWDPRLGHRPWVRDGTTQAKVAYGNGPSDQSVAASDVFDNETDLKAGYLFNESSGDLLDVSGNGNDGTVTGASQGGEGIVDGAYSFDGADDYVDLGNLLPNGDKTWTFWINFSNIGNREQHGSFGVDKRFYFGIEHTSNNYLWGVNGKYKSQDPHNFENNTWYYIALVLNGSEAKLYKNGSLWDTLTNLLAVSDYSALSLGSFGSDYNINGKIDDNRIHSSALSSDEITALYDATKSSPELFDQKAGEIIVAYTDPATNVTSTSATLNGILSSLEGESSLDVWFDYSTDETFSSYDSTSTQTLTATGSFSDDISGLTALETYYVRAVATDGVDTWYGSTVSFFATDFTYTEDEGSDFETGTLTDVEVVDNKLQLQRVLIHADYAHLWDGETIVTVGDTSGHDLEDFVSDYPNYNQLYEATNDVAEKTLILVFPGNYSGEPQTDIDK